MRTKVVPSLLSADFTELGAEVRRMQEAGAEILHVDVMDGHFVPNLSFGIPVLKALRPRTRLLLDVHLMISNPEERVDDFIEAGADLISVHVEVVTHLDRLLDRIREKGVLPGVVLNPHTPLYWLEEVLHKCHFVLLMSVNPGFPGQEFISTSLQKVRRLRGMLQERQLDVQIELDGGIGLSNIEKVAASGVDLAVAGSAIFGSDDSPEAFRTMQRLADEASVGALRASGRNNEISV